MTGDKRGLLIPQRPLYLRGWAAVGGHEESRGPLGDRFDLIDHSDRFGRRTWELAEGEMSRLSLNLALKRSGISHRDLTLLVAGDLQNQCVASSGGLLSFGIPYVGLYGACSTCTEALATLAAYLSLCQGEATGAAVTSSHNAAAERQFRTPLEYGAQRGPTAQWTATAAAALLLSTRPGSVRLESLLPGKMVDGAIRDATNMGAAMAPAAVDTVLRYFDDPDNDPDDIDLIVTGDLGAVGSELFLELLELNFPWHRHPTSHPRPLASLHRDCGLCLYDRERQDVHAGGSGCGCSAAVLALSLLPALSTGELRRILFLSTGALMSTSSIQQGGNIIGVAPLIRLSHVPRLLT